MIGLSPDYTQWTDRPTHSTLIVLISNQEHTLSTLVVLLPILMGQFNKLAMRTSECTT